MEVKMSVSERVCVDRILESDLITRESEILYSDTTRAVAEASKMWPNGSILRIKFLGGTSPQRTKVKQWATQWTEYANVTFEFVQSADADIRIAFVPRIGSWSYVGIDANGIPLDEPTMNFGWELDEGTVLHEFGHALGLGHEHQNPRGGILWNEQEVIKDVRQSEGWSDDVIRHNIINRYSQDQINGTQFDPHSIMLYEFPASWTKNGIKTSRNESLSDTDKAFIGSLMAYPNTGLSQDEALIDLDIDGLNKNDYMTRSPGEEDLFRFIVTQSGNYVIDIDGPYDFLYIRLYGSNNRTKLIGYGEEPQNNVVLNKKLFPGEYLVQIRFSPWATVSETYKIRVRRLD